MTRAAWLVIGVALLLSTTPCLAARRPPVVELKVCSIGPTWAVVTWQPVEGAAAYRLWHRPAGGLSKRRWVKSQTASTSLLLRDLRPETEYQLRLWALSNPEAPVKGNLRAKGQVVFTTRSNQPRAWEGVEVWPSCELTTLGPTTWPALAALSRRLFLFEVLDGGLYVSELAPELRGAGQAVPLLAGVEGTDRLCLTACPLGERLWLTWIERHGQSSVQMLASWLPDQAGPLQPQELARAQWCSMTPYGNQLWLIWQPAGAGDQPLVAAPYEVGTGLGESIIWEVTPAHCTQPTLASFAAQMAVAFTVEHTDRRSLWCALFNGEVFTNLRMLRRLGSSSAPRACALESDLYVFYSNDAHYPQSPGAASDLVVTQVGAEGLSLTTTALVHDGLFNSMPALAYLDGSIWVVYNKSSHDPAAYPEAVNHGSFLTRIALPPLSEAQPKTPAPEETGPPAEGEAGQP